MFFFFLTFQRLVQVRRRLGRLDVPSRGPDLSWGQTAAVFHQLGDVPVGGEHHAHEEAGLSRHAEEDDHHQVSQAPPAAGVEKNLTWPPFPRGTVHQSFPDFTFVTGNWIGKLLKLKGEIDPELAIDLCNRATLAFLQRHLSKMHRTAAAASAALRGGWSSLLWQVWTETLIGGTRWSTDRTRTSSRGPTSPCRSRPSEPGDAGPRRAAPPWPGGVLYLQHGKRYERHRRILLTITFASLSNIQPHDCSEITWRP